LLMLISAMMLQKYKKVWSWQWVDFICKQIAPSGYRISGRGCNI
jgi:hypothetical protein